MSDFESILHGADGEWYELSYRNRDGKTVVEPYPTLINAQDRGRRVVARLKVEQAEHRQPHWIWGTEICLRVRKTARTRVCYGNVLDEDEYPK